MTLSVLGGSAWSIGAQGITLLTAFFATPFIIRLLGTEDYGIWTLLNLLVAYFGFADLGMGAATTIFGSEAVAKGDTKGESAVIWTSVLVSALPVLVFAGLLWFAGRFLLDSIFALPPQRQGTAAAALKVAAGALIATAITGIFNTPQLARLKIGLNSAITTFSYIAQCCFILLSLWLGGRLFAIVCVMSGMTLLTAILHIAFSSRLSPGILCPVIDRKLIRPLVRFGSAVVVSALIGTFVVHGEKFLLVRLASVASLAHYNVAVTLAGLLGIVPAAVSVPLGPTLVRLRVANDAHHLDRTYNRLLRGVILFTLPAALGLCAIARTFTTFWAGPEFGRESSLPIYILSAGWLFYAASYLPRCLLAAWNRVDVTSHVQAFELIPYLIVAFFLTSRYGAHGAAAAWTLRVAAESLVLLRCASRITGARNAPLQRNRAVFLQSLALLTVPPFIALTLSSATTTLVTVTCCSLAAYGYMAYSRLIDEDERLWIRNLFSRFART
jgi:O-antigen/teichoic acid export membrane protein